MPWFTYKAINWLNKYLNKEMIVFEYGSGGSTLYLSNKVKELYSIEHNENWFKQVKRKLGSNRMNNVKVYLKKPIYKKSLKDVICKSTTFNQYLKYDFKEYVEAIDKFPDNYFDLIIIDGRARSSCIKHSVKKVKKNGYLLLDNSERLNYQSAINLLSKFKRTDYFGFGPTLNTFWQTSIWKK
jgi:predicted O-methyltransferase YrrM